ncbi:LLM class flavin-dependent oxidoreductase [Nonomuraea sp. NPDC004580]|uniref:LLM class flavin-dependent oxidoreductase n=1 Tax=Nonomuraea sp. NPDC004580 TaxID=3154552 RepID=UPI0033A1F2EC
MDIGVGAPSTVPGTDGRELAEFARRADRLGFSTLAVLDRLVYDSYDTVVTLAAAAAVTERITLAPTILLAAYRPSATLLAKQLASVDRLSGGRLVVGVAAGGREDDFTATGVPYGGRGRRLDAVLEEMERVWSGEVPGVGPRPQRGGIPLWVGGNSAASMARAARYGIGWISGSTPLHRYAEVAAAVRTCWADAGRTGQPRLGALAYVAPGADRRQAGARYLLDYYAYTGQKARFLAENVITDDTRLRETIDGYAAAGCDELMLIPCTSDAGQLDLIAKVAFG